MNLLFLDIDGVLNGREAFKNGYKGFERERVEYLNIILDKLPDIKIVISSAWRYMFWHKELTLKGFEYLFLTHGANIRNRIHGFTETDEKTMDKHRLPLYEEKIIRKQQIYDYIYSIYGKIMFNFVVLDDLNLNLPQLVKTDGDIGLTRDDVEKVISKFKLIKLNVS